LKDMNTLLHYLSLKHGVGYGERE
jgi:hypothetical protein